MTGKYTAQINEFSSQIEELWDHMDAIFESLGPADWARQHGPHWTFADVPYHLSYFDQEVIARPLQAGPELPVEEQEEFRTIGEVNSWNEARFASRPNSLTVAQALLAMEASRDSCRQAMAGMTDDDLSRPTWFSMHAFRGWRSAHFVLDNGRVHTFSHVMELRLRLGRDEHRPSSPVVHACLARLMGNLPAFVNGEAAQRDFTVVWEFSGPGGGAWTMRAAEGAATSSPGADPNPDLVMTQRPETFYKTLLGMHDPAEAMQSGEIQVSNFEALPAFGQLMAPPDPNVPLQVLEF